MRTCDFDYVLPEELIAQRPIARRDQSRLLVVDRRREHIEHRRFREIPDFLREDDLLVMNDTRVSAVRLRGRKGTGGQVEALLLRRLAPGVWEAMVRPGRRVPVGTNLVFDESLEAAVVDRTVAGGRILRFGAGVEADEAIGRTGEVPLPPYIRERIEDPDRYQTVYAAANGSAAAPTAGLHFTPDLLQQIAAKGVRTAFVTLHVGIATFRPVRTENVEDHDMHSEEVEVSPQAAEVINSAKGRIVCVGTTTARALESAATGRRRIVPMRGQTKLFITPPYDFRVVEGLVTNFHTPRSTLLMLVSAFAGTGLVRRAYEEAVLERYAFLSFGDAMFLH